MALLHVSGLKTWTVTLINLDSRTFSQTSLQQETKRLERRLWKRDMTEIVQDVCTRLSLCYDPAWNPLYLK